MTIKSHRIASHRRENGTRIGRTGDSCTRSVYRIPHTVFHFLADAVRISFDGRRVDVDDRWIVYSFVREQRAPKGQSFSTIRGGSSGSSRGGGGGGGGGVFDACNSLRRT